MRVGHLSRTLGLRIRRLLLLRLVGTIFVAGGHGVTVAILLRLRRLRLVLTVTVTQATVTRLSDELSIFDSEFVIVFSTFLNQVSPFILS